MMKLFSFLKFFLGTVAVSFLMAATAQAADQGSAAEAEAMVKKAVAYVKANGQEKAFEEFTNGKSFKDRDLYIFAYDMSGKNLAHGANPKLVGKDLSGLKDPDGKLIIQVLLTLVKSKGKGWSESFKFRNPVSEKMEPKIVYVERIGDVWVGSGIYKN